MYSSSIQGTKITSVNNKILGLKIKKYILKIKVISIKRFILISINSSISKNKNTKSPLIKDMWGPIP